VTSVLIVGGDSLIGSILARTLATAGHDIVVTSRRCSGPGNAVHLDLTAPDPAVTNGFDTVVLCAAITARRDCEADPDLARKTNVDAPVVLAKPVLERGGQLVFMSTSIVLGGDKPYLPHDAPYAPFDHYSRHKAEAERQLRVLANRSDSGQLVILRMAKVVDTSTGVVADWVRAAKKGIPITPYTDLVNAPVTSSHLANFVAQLIDARASGIHHVSGEEHSYAEIAHRLARHLGWPNHLVKPIEGRPNNPIAARNPPHASLLSDAPQSLDDVVLELTDQISKAR